MAAIVPSEQVLALLCEIKTGNQKIFRSMEGLENRMEGLEIRMEALESRMEGLENIVSRVQSDIEVIIEDILRNKVAKNTGKNLLVA
jgi:chaperonin cofactor prefoldin